MVTRFPVAPLAFCALAALMPGCGLPNCPNSKLGCYEPQRGYRLRSLEMEPGNTDDVFVCLCFSGGGTRAAAMSYGVLQALRATGIPGTVTARNSADPASRDADFAGEVMLASWRAESNPASAAAGRSLLQEVDAISSVSGGSFTAMAYGLDREDVFSGRYEKDFLKRNIQGRLTWMITRPLNLLRLPWALVDRIDLAANFYDKQIFHERTYQDLCDRGTRPFVVINATNMAMSERFEFTQDDFDLLGSDIRSMPVGHAVAASSAYPLLLSPMRLKYYPRPEGCTLFADIAQDPEARKTNARRWYWATHVMPPCKPGEDPKYCLDEDSHKYLYLLDGGLADNLGITFAIQELRTGYVRQMIDAGKIKKVVVVVVDAGTDHPADIEGVANAPGFYRMALSTGKTAIYNYSTAMTRVLRYMMSEEPQRLRDAYHECSDSITRDCPDAQPPEPPTRLGIDYYLVELNFRSIADPDERQRFLKMPTSLFLDSGDVDVLVSQGAKMLAENPEYQRLVRDLRGELPTRCDRCGRALKKGDACAYCR